MADFGAEVVAVEPPGGSPLRQQPAFPLWGRGKQSVVLDVHQDADLSALVDLVVGADVLVEALGPGGAERLGIDYEAVAKRNPGLIHASITGFGTEGPLAGMKGYEALVMAKVGGLSGFKGILSRRGPAFVSTPYASWSATQATLHGILAALYEREASGLGQRTETSLAHAVGALDPWGWMVQWLTDQYPDAFQAAPPVGEEGVPNSSFVYRLLVALTADGRWLQFSQVQPRLFQALMRSVGLDWMFDDPKWQGVPELGDPDVRVELWERLLEAVKEKTLDEWQRIFAADHDVWAEVFRSGSELLHHPQLVHNGMVEEIEDSGVGKVRQPGALVRMSETPARLNRSAPFLDEHSRLRTEGWPAQAPSDRPDQAPLPAKESVPTGRGALEGVTVLELGTFYAAPFGTTLLTDFGARVIKIEPLEGDPMRMILPFPECGAARVMQGKDSVALDMASKEGREIIHEIAKGSDLVLQCFRAGVAERLGVDAERVAIDQPGSRLPQCSRVWDRWPQWSLPGLCSHYRRRRRICLAQYRIFGPRTVGSHRGRDPNQLPPTHRFGRTWIRPSRWCLRRCRDHGAPPRSPRSTTPERSRSGAAHHDALECRSCPVRGHGRIRWPADVTSSR